MFPRRKGNGELVCLLRQAQAPKYLPYGHSFLKCPNCLGPYGPAVSNPSHLGGGSRFGGHSLIWAPRQPSGRATDKKFEEHSSWGTAMACCTTNSSTSYTEALTPYLGMRLYLETKLEKSNKTERRALGQSEWCPRTKRLGDTGHGPSAQREQEGGHLRAMRDALEEASPAGSLSSDSQPPELCRMNVCCQTPPHPRHCQ